VKKKILLTGCAGFIGSNFVNKVTTRKNISEQYEFHIIDNLTYAGKYENIQKSVESNPHLSFEKMDLRDQSAIAILFKKQSFDGVINFAAESHVDRSIENPNIFVETNVLGTLNLLQQSLKTFESKPHFKYLQISTDEVYGSLGPNDPAFTEENSIAPNSPYSASKASADLLCRAFYETYKLPVLITRCSNNYGPYQADEKFIPVIVKKALRNEKVPVYGAGVNIRDWIFVEDHNEGVWAVFEKGKTGEVYNLGGNCEVQNLNLAKKILAILGKPESLIQFVTDRKGHDFRYAMNFEKARRELGWQPRHTFDEALKVTVDWISKN
jgi:dTDP-glucose 4,6-dehydratase